MKKSLSLILALLMTGYLNSLFTLRAQETATAQKEPRTVQKDLTNQDILEMVKSGLASDTIIARIKSSATRFDTSSVALQELKNAGVPDSVVLAMMQTLAGATTTTNGSPANQPGEMVEVNIPDGTPVEVELVATASGQDLIAGDMVDFKVVLPVKVNDVIIIEKDAPAKAKVTNVKKSGHWGHAGKLEWAMQETVGVDGSHIPLRFTRRTVGDSKGGTVAVGAVATTVFLGPSGLLWGLKTGKPAIIPAGNRYTAFVNGNVIVKGRAAGAMTPATSSNAQ